MQNIAIRISGQANLQGAIKETQAFGRAINKVGQDAQLLQQAFRSGNLNLTQWKEATGGLARYRQGISEAAAATGAFTVVQRSVVNTTTDFNNRLAQGKVRFNDLFGKGAVQQMRAAANEQMRLNKAMAIQWTDDMGRKQASVFIPKQLPTDVKTLRAEMGYLNQVVGAGSLQLVNWGKNLQWTGRQLTVGFSVPLTMALGGLSKLGYELDHGMTQIVKVYGDAADAMQASSESIRAAATATAEEVARAYGQSMEDTMSVMSELAATGREGQDLIQMTQEVSRLSLLGDMGADESLRLLRVLQEAYKLSGDEIASQVDFFNAIENSTALTMQDIAEGLPRIAGIMQATGVSIEESTVLLTAFKEAGIDVAEGANALKSINFKAIAASPTAKDNFFRITGEDMSALVDKTNGEFLPMMMEIAQIMDGLDQQSKVDLIARVFGIHQGSRAITLLDQLANGSIGLQRAMEVMGNSAEENAASAQKEITALQESASSQLKRMWETMRVHFANFGQLALETILPIISKVSELVEWFSGLGDGAKKAMVWGSVFLAIIGPAVMLAGLMANLVGMFGRVISSVAKLIVPFRVLNDETAIGNAIRKASTIGMNEQTVAMNKSVQAITKLASSNLAYNDSLKQIIATERARLGLVSKPISTVGKHRQNLNLKTIDSPELQTGATHVINAAGEAEAKSRALLSTWQKISGVMLGSSMAMMGAGSLFNSDTLTNISGGLMSIGLIFPFLEKAALGFFAKVSAGAAAMNSKIAASTIGTKVLAGFNVALTGVKTAMSGLMTFITGPWGLAVGAAIGLIAWQWKKNREEIEKTKKVYEDIAKAGESLGQVYGYTYREEIEIKREQPGFDEDSIDAIEARVATIRESQAEFAESLEKYAKVHQDSAVRMQKAYEIGQDVFKQTGDASTARRAMQDALSIMEGEVISHAAFNVKLKGVFGDDFEFDDEQMFSRGAQAGKIAADGFNSAFQEAISDGKGSRPVQTFNLRLELNDKENLRQSVDSAMEYILDQPFTERADALDEVFGQVFRNAEKGMEGLAEVGRKSGLGDLLREIETAAMQHGTVGEKNWQRLTDQTGLQRQELEAILEVYYQLDKTQGTHSQQWQTIQQGVNALADEKGYRIAIRDETARQVILDEYLAQLAEARAASLRGEFISFQAIENQYKKKIEQQGKIEEFNDRTNGAVSKTAGFIENMVSAQSAYNDELAVTNQEEKEAEQRRIAQAGMDFAVQEAVNFYKDQVNAGLDAEMDALEASGKSMLDAIDESYEARQKGLQKRQEQEMDALEKQHDNQQKALQKQQERDQEALDKKHKAQDKALDAEADRMDARVEAKSKRLDKELELLKEQIEAEKEAAREAFDARWEGIDERAKKAQEDRRKAIEETYDKRVAKIEEAIEAEEKAEERRQKIFEAEKNRISRLANMFNQNITMQSAIASGNLDEAARISNSMATQQQEWAQDDASEISRTESQKRRDKMSEEIKEINELKTARLESLKETEQAEDKSRKKRKEEEQKELNRQLKDMDKRYDRQREVNRKVIDDEKNTNKRILDARRESLREQQAIEKKSLSERHKNNQEALRQRNEAERKSLQDKHKITQEALNKQREQAREAQQKENDARRRALEAQHKMKRDQLDRDMRYLVANRPKTQKEYDSLLGGLYNSASKHGVKVVRMNANDQEKIRKNAITEMDILQRQIMSDKDWEKTGEGILKAIANGVFGKHMDLKGMRKWIFEGKMPKSAAANQGGADKTLNSARHTGGIIGTPGGGRRGKSGSLRPSEELVNMEKGEGVINRKAMSRPGMPGFLEDLNNGRFYTPTRPRASGKKEQGDSEHGVFGQIAVGLGSIMAKNAARAMMDNSVLLYSEQRLREADQFGGYSGGTKISGNSFAGINLDSSQVGYASKIASVGKEMGMSQRDIIIGLMTAMQESTLQNLSGGDRDSAGLFQQRPSQGWGSWDEVTNPDYSSRKFFSVLKTIGGRDSMPLWQAAQEVQRSAFPYAYAKWENMARAMVGAMGGSVSGDDTGSSQNLSTDRTKRWADVIAGVQAMMNGEGSVGGAISGGGGGFLFDRFAGKGMGWEAMWRDVKNKFGDDVYLSSSKRGNPYTASGYKSYHYFGRAVDLTSPTRGEAGMADIFDYIRGKYGNKIHELFHSQMNNRQVLFGRPHYPTGVTRANHFDHVHWAMKNGGWVPGGWAGGDTVPVMAQPGEFVMSRLAAQQFGPILEAMNSGIKMETNLPNLGLSDVSGRVGQNAGNINTTNYSVQVNVARGAEVNRGEIRNEVTAALKQLDRKRGYNRRNG